MRITRLEALGGRPGSESTTRGYICIYVSENHPFILSSQVIHPLIQVEPVPLLDMIHHDKVRPPTTSEVRTSIGILQNPVQM